MAHASRWVILMIIASSVYAHSSFGDPAHDSAQAAEEFLDRVSNAQDALEAHQDQEAADNLRIAKRMLRSLEVRGINEQRFSQIISGRVIYEGDGTYETPIQGKGPSAALSVKLLNRRADLLMDQAINQVTSGRDTQASATLTALLNETVRHPECQ